MLPVSHPHWCNVHHMHTWYTVPERYYRSEYRIHTGSYFYPSKASHFQILLKRSQADFPDPDPLPHTDPCPSRNNGYHLHRDTYAQIIIVQKDLRRSDQSHPYLLLEDHRNHLHPGSYPHLHTEHSIRKSKAQSPVHFPLRSLLEASH